MPRYKLTIEYDGRGFVGWQRQPNGRSVQQAVEAALLAFTGETPAVHAAGRTDAGVHARGQVAHIDLAREWRTDVLRDAANAHLAPDAIALLKVEATSSDFEARFDAITRHYLYRIVNRRPPPTYERGLVWHVKRRLDAEAMHAAAQRLIGKHDFSTFRDADCQASSPVRTLDRLDVTRDGDEIRINVLALSFLHRQVRSIVGSLEMVGCRRWNADDLRAALDARDRARCGPVAPPDGLYLMHVDYREKYPSRMRV